MEEVTAKISRAESANRTSLWSLVGFIALAIWLLYAVPDRIPGVPPWGFLPALAAAVAAGRWHAKNRGKWLRLIRLSKYHERALSRMEDRWHGSGFSGEEFRIANHVYDVDLKVLGAGSLFELLCTARTGIGRRQLANYLLQPCSVDEALARQDAVRELMPQTEMRERIALLGKFDFQESTWNVFADWIAVPPAPASGWLRAAILAISSVLGTAVLLGFVTGYPMLSLARQVAPLLVATLAVAWFYRKPTHSLNAAASRVGVEIGLLREGIELVGRATLHSEKLVAIQRRLSDSRAASVLRRLERLTNGLAQCEKPQFKLFALGLAVPTQLCFAIEQWKLRHAGQLEAWLDAWGEFETLVTISGYAWEHAGDVFPEFTQGCASFDARDLGHPLIPNSVCVRNDVLLNSDTRFYIVSGSNMAGKSTLLRSIGLNAVLAKAGAPVSAASLRLSGLDVFASLSIVDSILEGKSKFLAEVERVKQMLESARQTPVLFLIDEILSGTNSRDRRVASEAIVRTLAASGAIGALSTHDLALTEIAELEGLAGSNVHMGVKAGGGPMDFDYLLKPGVTTETNALAIVAMMGIG
jgi:hypothetical protein